MATEVYVYVLVNKVTGELLGTNAYDEQLRAKQSSYIDGVEVQIVKLRVRY